LYGSVSGGFTQPAKPGIGVSIDVDFNGRPYVTNQLGEIYKYDTYESLNWRKLDGLAKDAAMGPSSGKLWKVRFEDLQLYYLGASNWIK
jgi:hypothetical protein